MLVSYKRLREALDEVEGLDPEFTDAATLGERMREVRNDQSLSLQALEDETDGEFKAAIVGAYERGERNITVVKLQRLADWYGVGLKEMLP